MKLYYRRPKTSEQIPPAEEKSRSFKFWLVIFLILIGLVYFFYPKQEIAPQPAPGVLIAGNPIQTSVKPIQFKVADYQLTAQAQFNISARVLSKHYYNADRESDISPVDLAVGWGYMSDSAYLNHIEISQRNRWYFWQTMGSLPFGNDYIIKHSANLHIVPINEQILKDVKTIKVNNVIQLQGYLINVRGTNNYRWNTSLTREDTGDHSCEIMLVTDVKIYKDLPTQPASQ